MLIVICRNSVATLKNVSIIKINAFKIVVKCSHVHVFVSVLFIVATTLERRSVCSEHCFHLEMSLLTLVCLLTTGGSLTYIGSYISGAKSMPQQPSQQRDVSYELVVQTYGDENLPSGFFQACSK